MVQVSCQIIINIYSIYSIQYWLIFVYLLISHDFIPTVLRTAQRLAHHFEQPFQDMMSMSYWMGRLLHMIPTRIDLLLLEAIVLSQKCIERDAEWMELWTRGI